MTNPIDRVDSWTLELAGKDWCIRRNAPPLVTIAGLDADLDPVVSRQPFRQGGLRGETITQFDRVLARWQNNPPPVATHFLPKMSVCVGYLQHHSSLGTDKAPYPSILLGEEVSNHLSAVDALRLEREAMMAHYLGDRGVRP